MGVEMANALLAFRNTKTICYVNNSSAVVRPAGEYKAGQDGSP